MDSSGRVAWVSLTQFVRATVIVALVDAIGIAMVAAILGVPFVLAIGVLVFLGAFVPMIGATIAGTVAILVALVDQGPFTALLMLGGVILVQQIEGHILQPFLMGRWVSVHPLAVIVAIGCGVLVAGIAGALIAVPLAATANAVVQHLSTYTEIGDDPEEELEEDLEEMGADDPAEHPDLQAGRGGDDAMTITVEDIEEAARLLDGVAIYTPMDGARWLSDRCGGEVRLKCENLQRTGSFKMRGAYTRISRLSDEEKAAGVVAASAGNHAQGVALSAKLLGVKATVFMPEGAPIPKVNATMGYGADVVFHGQYLHHAMEAALAFAAETGAVLIHPYDHVDIVTGQGTAGLEILAQIAPGADRPRADRRRGTALGHRDRDQGQEARRARRRRAGEERRGVPALAPGRPPGAPRQDEHDGRRHRRRRPRRPQLRDHPRPRRRHRHGLGGVDGARAARRRRAGEVRRRALRCGRGRRDAWTTPTPSRPRRSRCSPAATSTRCCSAR